MKQLLQQRMQKVLQEIDLILKEIEDSNLQNSQEVLDFEDDLNKRSIVY
jgi:hypothetical protein